MADSITSLAQMVQDRLNFTNAEKEGTAEGEEWRDRLQPLGEPHLAHASQAISGEWPDTAHLKTLQQYTMHCAIIRMRVL